MSDAPPSKKVKTEAAAPALAGDDPFAWTATLSNGLEMPLVGFGTYKLKEGECRGAVRHALARGYKLIDTAHVYGGGKTEPAVGKAAEGSDAFVITKQWRGFHGYAETKKCLDQSLRRLGRDRVDLLLIHWPGPGYSAMGRSKERVAKEGIEWEAVDFFDNKTVCDLIESKRPFVGLLAYLEEETLMPQGTDATFYGKISTHLTTHAHFDVPSGNAALGSVREKNIFTIKHYAGDVIYSAHLLLEKNRDSLYVDLLECAGASKSAYVASLFPEAGEKASARKRPPTAATQFRTSMGDLVATLTKCTPHYIRTIKPNDEKRAGLFDEDRVRHQVRYLGLLENVRVRRAGYAFRQPLQLFVDRFRVLCPLTWPHSQLSGDVKREASAILSECAVSDDAYKFGTTKLFVRKPLTLFALEELRARRLHDVARMLQTAFRAYASRKYFLELREQAQGIFSGQKRRRGSWALYFLGDYIHAAESAELTRVLSKRAESRILFADIAEKVNRKRKSQARALVVTEAALYTMTPGTFKLTNRVPLEAVKGIAMSTYADGFFILRIAPGLKDVPADLIMCSVRKAEILTMLVSLAREAGRELALQFSDRLEYRSKKSSGFFGSSGLETRVMTFSEDTRLGNQVVVAELDEASLAEKGSGPLSIRVSPALGSLASIQLNASTPKVKTAWDVKAVSKQQPPPKKRNSLNGLGHAAGGGAGGGGYGQRTFGGGGEAALPARHPPLAAAAPAKAPPLPPPPTNRRQTFSSFPLAQGIHAFTAADSEQLSFGTGAVLHILEQGSTEWWTAELDGKVGLVPSNRVKLL